MTETKCTPGDCRCGPYEDPYENYWYSHTLNPAQQYFWWIYEWKRQVTEIHNDCVRLGQNSYSEDYVQGIVDATPPTLFTPMNNDWTTEFEFPDFMADPELRKIEMSVDQWLMDNFTP